MTNQANIRRNLRQLRRLANLTQKELAERINVIPLTIRNWESGKHHIRSKYIPALCDALGVTVDVLQKNAPDIVPVVQEVREITLFFEALKNSDPEFAIELHKVAKRTKELHEADKRYLSGLFRIALSRIAVDLTKKNHLNRDSESEVKHDAEQTK